MPGGGFQVKCENEDDVVYALQGLVQKLAGDLRDLTSQAVLTGTEYINTNSIGDCDGPQVIRLEDSCDFHGFYGGGGFDDHF